MKFKYSLEGLLKYNKNLQDFAQKDYAQAQNNVNELLKKIEELYNKIDGAREQMAKVHEKGGYMMSLGVGTEDYIKGNEFSIGCYKNEVRQLMEIAEEKLEQLKLASIEFKKVDKLKEKKKEEFIKNVRKKREASLEEIVIMRRRKIA